MDDAARVQIGEAGRRLADVVGGLGERARPLLFHQPEEVRPLDVFQHEVGDLVRFVGVVGGDDIGMLERGGRLHLALEPLHRVAGTHHRGGQKLERDDAVHRPVQRLEDEPHAPRVERVEDHVIVDEQRILRRLEQHGRLVPREFAFGHELRGDLRASPGKALASRRFFSSSISAGDNRPL